MSEMMLSLTLMTAFFFDESNDDDKAEIPSGLSSDDSSGKYLGFLKQNSKCQQRVLSESLSDIWVIEIIF